MRVDHASAVKKRDHQKFVGGFALSGLLGSGRANMLPLGILSRSSRSRFNSRSPEHQELRDLNWSARPAVMTPFFFLIFSEHPWDNFHTNLPHLQFLANNCVYSATLTLNCAPIVSIETRRSLSMKFFIWTINSCVLTSLLLPHLLSSLTDYLPAFLESLMPLKNWC